MKYTKRADGRYQSKVYIGNGKYKYAYASSPRELTKKIDEIKLKMGKGIDIKSERDTFGEWAERWLKLKKAEVSYNRYQSYVYRLRNLSSLYDMPISKIRTIDIQDVILEMRDKRYAYKTIKEAKNVTNQVFQLAISNRVTEFNPSQAVRLPSEAPHETRRALTKEEQAWINAPTAHRGHRIAMIMMYAGLRRGELIPLLWTDIDLEAKTISINKAIEIVNGKSIVKQSAKTKTSIRTVYIPQILVDFLYKEDRGNSLYVCPNAKGGMMSETAYKRVWDSYLQELNFNFGNFDDISFPDKDGKLQPYQKPNSRFTPRKIPFVIPHITAHWLRHTFITMMYFAGVDIMTAKEQAGHADVQTTMEIYTHLDSKFKKRQIDKLDDYINQSNGNMGVK